MRSSAVVDTPLACTAVTVFADLASIPPQQIWEGIAARSVHGERITMSVVELDPGAVVAEHSHENEQLGIVLRGTMDFRVGDERMTLSAGGTWRIPPNTPHEAIAGPEGAVVIDVFAPTRDDWEDLAPLERVPRWPASEG
jgi:quercetin dioxygenase-like cupin family protein